MNDPAVTMSDPTCCSSHGPEARRIALEAATAALRLIRSVPPPLTSVGDQEVRAAGGAPANLAGSAGRTGRDRSHPWRIASASALELSSHLELPMGVGAVGGVQARAALELFDRVRALTWRVLHPNR